MRDQSDSIKVQLVEVCAVATLWVVLFRLNHWLFSAVEVSPYINWVFLPAALRVLSVLVLDLSAVAGLFIGTLITCDPVVGVNLADSLILSSISSLSPLLAVRLMTRWMRSEPDLKGMTFAQLAAISTLSGVASSTIANFYFHLRDQTHDWMTGVMPMLIGDLVGTLIVLFIASQVLRRLSHLARR